MDQGEIKEILEEIGVHPSRRLGQNFLSDAEAARWIVDQIELEERDLVIEVGPGLGALTEHFGERARRIVAIEKDQKLATYLKWKFRETEIEIREADALETDLREFYPEGPVKFIGNLPYSAGGEIIRLFLRHGSPIGRAVIMVQKEVAQRLAAGPGTKAYGVLSLRVQSCWNVSLLRDLGPELFYPEPQIDSSVVLLEPKVAGELPLFDRKRFDSLAKRGFSQRRKQLKKLLGPEVEDWGALTEALGVAETVRGEALTLEQWVTLTNLTDPSPPVENQNTGDELFDVVDENDDVLRQVARREVHAQDLLHRAVHMFVFNKVGELFLQKRTHTKDRHPGAWDSSAAGHVDAGEDYDTAAYRELEEELGLKAEPGTMKMVGRIAPCENTGWEFVQIYETEAKGKMRWEPSEVEYGEFFSMETVRKWVERRPEDFATGFLECLRVYEGKS